MNEGPISPTQFDMERRSDPIYNQINVLTTETTVSKRTNENTMST